MADMESRLDHSQFGNRRQVHQPLPCTVGTVGSPGVLQDGQSAHFLAIDYSKAFDRVDITVSLQ